MLIIDFKVRDWKWNSQLFSHKKCPALRDPGMELFSCVKGLFFSYQFHGQGKVIIDEIISDI